MLPGGIVVDGERRRSYAFRPVDGTLEAALAGAAAAPSLPVAVTAALAAALAQIGGEEATAERVRELAVGDRQFLARQLATHLGHDALWLTASCRACGEALDLAVRPSDLPVKEAGAGYPHAQVGPLRLRVPTGADQEAIAGLPDDQALAALYERCCLDEDAGRDPAEWSDDDRATAEAAVEAAAPEVAGAVLAACPACGAESEVAVDPYLGLFAGVGELFQEVHRLASVYHWSEEQILALPRDRRQLYLRLIERERGLVS